MDVDDEQQERSKYTKVSSHDNDEDERMAFMGDEPNDGGGKGGAVISETFVDEGGEDLDSLQAADTSITTEPTTSTWEKIVQVLHWNFLPEQRMVIGDFPLVEGEFTMKFLKFLLLTFASIAIVHKIVALYFEDRDQKMTLFHIWHFDTNLIVMDSLVYFVVGRMWKQRGVDHLAWILPIVVCNVYFESQNYIGWLQHSVSLFEIHCLWPWQLWIFVLVLVPTIGGLVVAHLGRAWNKRILLVKVMEAFLCLVLFLSPFAASPYFHLHHWFAGWLLGMHCNFDVWWSRAAMAYCWVR